MSKIRLPSGGRSLSLRVNSRSLTGVSKKKTALAKKKDRARRKRMREQAKAEKKRAAANASPLTEEEKRERARNNLKPRLRPRNQGGVQGFCH